MIDKALHSSRPAVDQDYRDVVFDGVAPLCLEVSLLCPDLHSQMSSADEIWASLVCLLLKSYCCLLSLTGPSLD